MQPKLDLVYDGECPFCSRYAALVRLREQGIDVRLHDARRPETFQRFPEASRFDLDEGMLALWQGEWHHGEAAVHLVSRLSRRAPLARFLRHRRLARLAYPLLRAGRNAALRLKGKGPISPRGS